MSASPNLEELKAAYEGLETDFADRQHLESYRAVALERSRLHADFLAERLSGAAVLDVGCGNGRVLIALGQRGTLRSGHGVDLAQSRIQFARRWAIDAGLPFLTFDADDAFTMALPASAYDAILCISGAFAYFEPLTTGSAAKLAERWCNSLRPGGLVVLETYPHPELLPLLEASGGSLRLWRELDPADPWRFYLSEFSFRDGILVHSKTFVHRRSGAIDSGRTERLKLYKRTELEDLANRAGFVDVSSHEGWTTQPYAGGGTLVLTGRRPA